MTAPRVSAFLLLCLTAPGLKAAGPVPVPFTTVSNPPVVQMLVPGFTVRELPLDLNNLNNIVYAPDGRCFALCYDGTVLQLFDTDGDGLEDKATHFYKNERNEITTCIDMAWGPGGLYIPAKGRIVRIRDQGDGTGKLETVTSGWPLRANATKDFDSYGIAINPAGDLFFGLCTENMRNAYLINTNTGGHDYSLQHPRGTICRLPANSQTWEVIATGFRYQTALEFNAAGDLFALDQEGATWLPNGNPLDELLHIQPGRHYGFPPRHPKYLPQIIDEPSVFDYGPQHQSTCDLHFNDPVAPGTNSFGPAWWRGDALVTGESRGKIYRTKLVKTTGGYVAQTHIIACLNMLTIEAAPTPRGDLLVTLHSGRPDWGTGPLGKGKLYKISHSDKTAPQPVLAYAASPTETRIIFDRPLDPSQTKSLAANSRVIMGVYVSAGDRFETMRPGYQAVKSQMRVPRYELPVLSATVSPDRRAVVLHTVPRTEPLKYSVTLPSPVAAGVRRRTDSNDATASSPPPHVGGYAPQHAGIDLLTELTGMEATWADVRGRIQWSGWLPHPDLTVARALTSGSEEHARLFELLTQRGTLTLRGQLDLWYMLRAKTQPTSTLDFEYPPETVTVVMQAGDSLKLKTDLKVRRVNSRESRLTIESKPGRWMPLEITLATGAADPKLDVSWFTHEDSRPRALPLRRIFLPWAAARADTAPLSAVRSLPEIAGGDWARGRSVFLSDQVACYKCHQIRGEGQTIGSDLSNLIFRDYASVVRDIQDPNAALDPDYLAYTVQLKDGETQTGVLLNHTQTNVVLAQVTGRLDIPADQVSSLQPSPISLMPTGLLDLLNEQQRRDLLTFLLTESPKNAASGAKR